MLLLFFCLLNCYGARALPVPPTPEKRSTFEIFWSCCATIFICTWTSMHPNIPPRRQSQLRASWRKIVLMFWALIVPELILTWAVKQWLAARSIEKHFKKDHNWTRTHAHFLGMGGFTLVNTVRFKPEIPQIRDLTVPVQPEMPEYIQDGQHWSRMERYWNEMERFRRGRRRFYLDWERAQRSYTEYMYFNAEIFRNQDWRLQVDINIQDYKRYETYGHPLPDAIKYMYESPGTLSFYRFRDLVEKESIISFPTITAEEINDRSKVDILAKTIAVIQTTSFILQLVARVGQRLPITELELVTLALASLNGVIYFFWWDKPLGVQEPVALYFRGVMPVNRYEDELEQGFFASVAGVVCKFFKDRLKEIENSKSLFGILRVVLRWILYQPISTVVLSLYAIVETSDIPAGATHVPRFYTTNITSSELDVYLVYFVSPIVAIGFGGLHCLGWNFTFRTSAEQILWRVSSLTITATPLVSGLVVSFIRRRLSDMKAQREVPEQNIITKCVVYAAFALLSVYVLARLSLLIQALTSLWREQDGVLHPVDWSKYLPGIS